MHYCEYDEFDHYGSGVDYSRAAFELPHKSLPLELAPDYVNKCLCCGTPMRNHYSYMFTTDRSITQRSQDVCTHCGFWYHVDMCGGDYDGKNIYLARLKKFDLTDKATPCRQIIKWLASHPDDVYFTHPRRFEEVVGSILTEFMDCEFAMTAESADGGVDLVGYDSQKGKVLVEVKRYRPERRISVRLVRHLAGVLVRENVTRGVLVATSDFTSPSRKEVEKLRLMTQDYPISIDLLRFRDLLPWLQVAHEQISKPKVYSKSYWDQKLSVFRELG